VLIDYTQENISNSLIQCGIKRGDSVFIHSNIGFFGNLKNANRKEDFYQSFKEAILEVIGEEGTIIVPAFSYTFCNKEIFNVRTTKGVCGFFSEQLRLDPTAFRSEDANFSVAALGRRASFFTENVPEYSFGYDSFWDRFLKNKGVICNFNFDAGSTFIHYVERSLKVPYRYDKPFPGILVNAEGKEEKRVFYHFVYDLNTPELIANFERFSSLVLEKRIATTSNLGKGRITKINAEDVYDFIETQIKFEPYFLTAKGR